MKWLQHLTVVWLGSRPYNLHTKSKLLWPISYIWPTLCNIFFFKIWVPCILWLGLQIYCMGNSTVLYQKWVTMTVDFWPTFINFLGHIYSMLWHRLTKIWCMTTSINLFILYGCVALVRAPVCSSLRISLWPLDKGSKTPSHSSKLRLTLNLRTVLCKAHF